MPQHGFESVSVEADPISMHSKFHNLALIIASSLLIYCPESGPKPSTAKDLRALAESAGAWVARTGSCRVNFVVTITDSETVNSQPLPWFMESVTQTIETLQIWSLQGLRLARVNDSLLPFNVISFSLDHPFLTSPIHPPETIPVAPFRQLTCCLYFYPQSASARKSHSYSEEQGPGLTMEANKYHALPLQDIGTLATSLLEDGLACLISGKSSGRTTRASRDQTFLSLMALAPAVFDANYLQAISERLKFAPVISSSLADLRYAQSPQLRRRAKESEISGLPPGNASGYMGRLWKLVVTTTKAPLIKSSRSKSKAGWAAPVLDQGSAGNHGTDAVDGMLPPELTSSHLSATTLDESIWDSEWSDDNPSSPSSPELPKGLPYLDMEDELWTQRWDDPFSEGCDGAGSYNAAGQDDDCMLYDDTSSEKSTWSVWMGDSKWNDAIAFMMDRGENEAGFPIVGGGHGMLHIDPWETCPAQMTVSDNESIF